MSDYEFWQHMQNVGQVTYSWWYPTIALSAFILSLSVLVLTTVATQRYKKFQNRFLMLFFATIPAVLTFPAMYWSIDLVESLNQIGFTLPNDPNDFARSYAISIGRYLNMFGIWALIGTTMTIPIFISGFYNTDVPILSPAIRSVTKTITTIATRAFGRRGGDTSQRIHAPFGMFIFKKGSRTDAIEALRPDFIIGSKGDIQVPDSIVSRSHAKVLVNGKAVSLLDLGSTNGTYILRRDQTLVLNGEPIELTTGDLVYLGDPQKPEAIEIIYERQ